MNIKKIINKINKKENILFWIGISTIINIVCILMIKKISGISFYSTDDTAMMSIVSGSYNGEPNPKMLFIKYPMGIVLSILYNLSKNISWYSVVFIGMITVSMILLLARILWASYRNNKLYIGILTFLVSYVFVYMFNISLQQFTLVSALVACAAFYWFLTIDYSNISKRNIIEIIIVNILLYIALCIRFNVVVMFVPFMVLFAMISIYKERQKFKSFCVFFMFLLISVISIQLIDSMAYRSNEYKSYKDFSYSRSQVYDYYGKPDYDENEEFYNSLNIDRNIYESINKYNLLLDESINSESLELMAKKSKEENKNELSINIILKNIYQSYTSNDYYKYSYYITLFLIIISIIYTTIKKRYDLFIFNLLSLGGAILGSFYFVIKGRFPGRISMIIVLIINIIAMYTIITIYSSKKSLCSKSLFILLLLPNVFMKEQIFNMNNIVKYNNEAISKREIFENYCFTNSDNFYFHETGDFVPNYKNITLRKYNRVENFSVVGGWTTPSPYRDSQYSKWGIDNFSDSLIYNDNVYYCSKNYPLYIKKYMEDKYNKPIRVEIIDYIVGLSIPVYEFSFDESLNYEEVEIADNKLHNLYLKEDISGYRVEVSGIDPYINDIISNKEIDGIKIDILSDKKDSINIYYKINGKYSEENNVTINLENGESSIYINKDIKNDDIRIDFSENSNIIIKSINGYTDNN